MGIPGSGGLPARRVDQLRNPPPTGVQAGSSAGIVRARLVIVSGPGAGVFVYSGTPALGNPPIAWMSSGTTDPFGNPVTVGFGTTSGVFSGPDFILNTAGLFIYSGTPALGNLIGSWAGAAGTDGFGNAYPQGLNVALGAISGTVFTGTDFIINTAGAFFYSGTPAAGNLLASIAPVAGTDGFGNAYVKGTGSYAASGAVTAINGAVTTVYSGAPAGGTSDNLVASIAPANTTDSAGNTVQAGMAVYQTQGGVGLVETIQLIGSIIQWINASGGNKLVLAQDAIDGNLSMGGATGNVLAAPPVVKAANPSSLSIPETWHTVSSGFPAGWSGTFQYAYLPIGPPSPGVVAEPAGAVGIRCELTPPGVAVPDGTVLLTLPAGWRPNNLQTIPAVTDGGLKAIGGGEFPQLRVNSSGSVTCLGIGTNSTYLQVSGLFWLGT